MIPSDRDTDLVIRRLRARTVSSWSPERVALARDTVQRLADLAADAEGQPRRVVPALHPVAIADQLELLAHDATTAGADQRAVAALFGQLAVELAVR
jgi:hypothetical protein